MEHKLQTIRNMGEVELDNRYWYTLEELHQLGIYPRKPTQAECLMGFSLQLLFNNEFYTHVFYHLGENKYLLGQDVHKFLK